jgi:hypothetical protein
MKGHIKKVFIASTIIAIFLISISDAGAVPIISGIAQISRNASYPYIKDYDALDINCDGMEE